MDRGYEMKINLSEKSKEIIKQKVEEFNTLRSCKVNETEMLGYMIEEFSQSTKSERQEQHIKKVKTLYDFLLTKNESIEDAWKDGWKNGWYQFQTRKYSSRHLKRGE